MLLTLDPTTMALMDDRHLLNALYAEPEIMRTSVELELMRRFSETAGGESAEEVESRIAKSYESPLEQSEFRAQALVEILELCDKSPDRYRETKELIAAIRATVENSYVEL